MSFPRYLKLPDPNAPPPDMALHRSNQTPETMCKASYWRKVCPELHVNGKDDFQPASANAIMLPKIRQNEISKQIEDEGYVKVKAEELAWEGLPPMDVLARNIVRLMQHGWPASFFSMYDESWALVHQLSRIMERATGNQCNMDLLAWYVDPNAGNAGFSPHRDRQPDDSPASFRQDGTPMYSTCWIPFTDACPANSCLYVLPRQCDPGYYVGDDDNSEVDPLPLALDCKQAYQNIRAIPAEAGSAVMFTHRIIHWGSRGRKGYHTPRISFSFGCSREGEAWEPAYFDRRSLPFPAVGLRAALASAQLIVYHERFEIDRRQLVLFHETYTRQKRAFSAKYQREVNKEFVNATKEVMAGQPDEEVKEVTTAGTGPSPREAAECSRAAAAPQAADSDEDDVMDRMMDEMLNAEMGGYGDDLEDDFDTQFRDDDTIDRVLEGKKGKKQNKAGKERPPGSFAFAKKAKLNLGLGKKHREKLKMQRQMRKAR